MSLAALVVQAEGPLVFELLLIFRENENIRQVSSSTRTRGHIRTRQQLSAASVASSFTKPGSYLGDEFPKVQDSASFMVVVGNLQDDIGSLEMVVSRGA